MERPPSQLPAASVSALSRPNASAAARAAGVVVWALALLGLLLASHPLLFRALGELLVLEQAPIMADAALLLNGGLHTRPEVAAALYRQGYYPRILIAETPRAAHHQGDCGNVTLAAVRVLREHGVPESAISVLPFGAGVTSTQDEARALAAYLRHRPADRILLVTSDYHSGRARWTVRREVSSLSELGIATAPEPFSATDWWRTEQGLIAYASEYAKWVHTLLR